MNKYTLLCIDDEREVLDSILADLELFSDKFDIEAAQSVAEAREVLTEMETEQRQLALILCDHIMPNDLGVDFLVALNQDDAYKATKKLLLTGQAGLDATIEAVNNGGLDYYIAKPWDPQELQQIIKQHLTDYIITNESEPLSYSQLLDTQKIFAAIAENRLSI